MDIRPEPITAVVVGVYGTLHTDKGDVDTGLPVGIRIDCEVMTFDLPVVAPFSARVTGFTMHFGVSNLRLKVDVPNIRRGDHVTVVQRIDVSEMARATLSKDTTQA